MMAAHDSLAGRLKESVWTHLGDEDTEPADRLESIGASHDEFKSLCMTMCKSLLMKKKGKPKAEDSEYNAIADASTKAHRLADEIEATLARSIGFDA
jgi:hypothetical protein